MIDGLMLGEVVKLIDKLDVKQEIQLLKIITADLDKKVSSLREDDEYWQSLSRSSLDRVWDNDNDEVYNELYKR